MISSARHSEMDLMLPEAIRADLQEFQRFISKYLGYLGIMEKKMETTV